MGQWLCTDEHEEAIAALEMAAESSTLVLEDAYRWKWVIIATHNAVQGFMVLALRQGNGLLALKDNIAAQWLKAYEEGSERPVEKLDNFLNLFKKVKSARMLCCFGHSRCFEANSGHNRAVKKLNQIRNDFIHFVPKSWSLEITGLPEICLSCLEMVEFLGWDSGNIQWHDEIQKRRAGSALERARSELNAAKVRYEAAAEGPHDRE